MRDDWRVPGWWALIAMLYIAMLNVERCESKTRKQERLDECVLHLDDYEWCMEWAR